MNIMLCYYVIIECLCGMFARFGLPEQFVTDNSSQWTAEKFKFLKKITIT